MLYFIFLIISPLMLFAEPCFTGNAKDIKLKWTAYKTPLKIGVSGHLDGLVRTGPARASSIRELISKTSLTISTKSDSVNSKDKARDIKISTYFFEQAPIKVKISKIDDKNILAMVTMGGKMAKMKLNYRIDGMKFHADGFLDILDFAMNKSLARLNNVCNAKHEGKTWSDVMISIDAEFSSCKE